MTIYVNPEAPEPNVEGFDFYAALAALMPQKMDKKPTEVAVRGPKDLLTLDEVATLLSVSRRSVTRLTTIKRRKDTPRLRTVREGRSVRVTRADLDSYVTRLRVEAGIKTR